MLPNVLFVTADQWRGDSLSCAGHPVVRTPNLDRLAASGVRFARHFAQTAPCGPSRASLYTGMYLMNHRSATNGTPLDARHTNIALEARKLGYRPALFGYTDTSVDPRTVPPGDERLYHYEGVLPGFDPVCHLPEGDPDAWLTWLRAEGYDVGSDWRLFVDQPVAGYPGADEWGPHRAPTQYAARHSQTAFLTDKVLDFVEAQPQRWFAHLSYLRPHPPFFAPEPYNTMYDPMTVPLPVRATSREAEGAQHPLVAALVNHPFLTSPDDEKHLRQLRATYYGMQSEVDDQLGRILDHLDASGAAERTIVVMTSDHGEMLGDHFLMHKLGWFDSSYHVPLIVRDPRSEGDAHRGTVVEAFTEHVDVLPTVLDLLATEVPLQCDGRPLTGFLRGDRDADRAGEPEWRNEAHFEFDFRDAGSDLLEQAFGLTLEECSIAVLRDDHGKYVHFAGMAPIYFDLDTDPEQIVNRAGDAAYAPVVLEYAQRMLSWRMQHQERTLTGMKLTGHAGLVERRAPRK